METATGTFDVLTGDETEIEESGDGVRLTHASGTQRFSGSIEGDGSVDWLMCYVGEGDARLVGLQRISGTIDGRTGTVVIDAVGHHHGTASNARWHVVEGTGTGELAGIRGVGGIDAPGGPTVSYRLDYEID